MVKFWHARRRAADNLFVGAPIAALAAEIRLAASMPAMTRGADVDVRPARQADFPDLQAILYDTFESTWWLHITALAVQAFLEERRPVTYLAQHGIEAWVAERDDVVCGLVHWQDDFIQALHVRPCLVRSGIGSCLMDRAEAEIAASGFAAARLETDTFNTASQEFYAAFGYREVGRYPDKEWCSDLTTILFTKSLL